jgi:hypothetical protein
MTEEELDGGDGIPSLRLFVPGLLPCTYELTIALDGFVSRTRALSLFSDSRFQKVHRETAHERNRKRWWWKKAKELAFRSSPPRFSWTSTPMSDSEATIIRGLRQTHEHIRAALQDPALSSCCVVNLIGLLLEVKQADRREHPLVQATYSEGFAWITRPRTRAELGNLSQLRCSCPPPAQNTGIHLLGAQVLAQQVDCERQPFSFLMYLLLSPAYLPWIDPHWDERGKIRLDRLVRRKYWPRSLKNILPHGLEFTTRAVIALYTIAGPGNHKPLHFTLRTFVVFSPSTVVPILVTSEMFIHLTLKEAVTQDRDIIESDLDTKGTAYRWACESILALGELLRDLVQDKMNEAQRHALHRFTGSHFSDAYQVGLLICKSMHNMATHRTHVTAEGVPRADLKWLEASLANFTYLREQSLIDTVWSERGFAAMCRFSTLELDFIPGLQVRQAEDHNVWYRFIQVLRHLQDLQKCAALGCLHTLADGPLKECAGCQRVRYCSRACQKRAWGHHRAVCTGLANLTRVLHIPQRDIATTYQNLDVAANAWLKSDALVIIDHFYALSKLDMTTSCERAVSILRTWLIVHLQCILKRGRGL